MKLRTIITMLAVSSLIGCGDGATATEVDDGGSLPTDSEGVDTSTSETTPSDGSTDETATPSDTGTTPADTMTAGDTSTSASMKCGATTCSTATQDCCITAGIGVCTTKGGACLGARYSCTSKSNCGSGQVCCISGAGTGGASCSSTCPSTTTCDTNADCSGSMKNCTDIGGGIKACSK